jgi:hypothetical protein
VIILFFPVCLPTLYSSERTTPEMLARTACQTKSVSYRCMSYALYKLNHRLNRYKRISDLSSSTYKSPAGSISRLLLTLLYDVPYGCVEVVLSRLSTSKRSLASVRVARTRLLSPTKIGRYDSASRPAPSWVLD